MKTRALLRRLEDSCASGSESLAEGTPVDHTNARLHIALRHWRTLLAGILLISVVLSCAFASTKRPWCDEAWFASPAYNLLHHGSMRTTILDPHGFAFNPDLKGIDHFTYWIMPGYLLAQAAWYKVVGFTLFSMRSLSITWSVVGLLSWFAIVNWITRNRGIALLSVFLLGTEQQFIRSAGFGRMDMMCFAIGLASIATYLHFRETRFLFAVGTSACLAILAMLTHPNGLFSALLLAGFVIWLDRKRISVRAVMIAALSVSIPGALWALYIGKAPDLFLAQIHTQSAFLSLSANPIRLLVAEISERYSQPYALTASFPISIGSFVFYMYLLAMALNLFVPSLRRSRATRLLLVMTAFQFAGLVCVKKSWYYILYILPFYTAMMAITANWLFLKARASRLALCVVLALITVINTGFILGRVWRSDKIQFQEAVNYLRQNIKPGDLIMGSGELGFGLGFDGQVLDDARLGFLSGKVPTYIVIEPQYRSYWLPWLEIHEPAAYVHIRSILNRYDRVYDQSSEGHDRQSSGWPYQIYQQPNPQPRPSNLRARHT